MSSKTITSFGSAFITPDEPLYTEIEQLGKLVAESGYDVCSGGYYGSMEAISKGSFVAGGKTIGIGVKGWEIKPNQYLTGSILAENLMDRILKLINAADAYIIFKGGTGTLLEISAALELMNKKAMPEKKMIFYTDFWKNMISILQQDTDSLKEILNRNIFFIQKPAEILKLI